MVGVSEIGAAELTAAIPRLSGTLQLKELTGKVEVYRDSFGIPYVRAENERDAFIAQGFVTAQDRLWHMEYDRLRGSGRWAEAVGDGALEQDKLMRRFRLTDSAKADYAAMDDHTRMVFDAYAAGVNAFIEGPDPLPAEYAIAGIEPEPWQPWHSLVVYKARHILMGVFESKIWRARMVRAMGPEKAGQLFPGYEPGHLLILPPGAAAPSPLDVGFKELAEGAAALNHLSEMDGGSNSWALAGDSTATGKPLVAGDSHRALDTPNAYYQNRIACPEFDVIGLSFPGVPAFPHFGHNPWVCWCVTHTAADYQDLYIEQLRDGDTPQYLYKDEWRNAEVHHETIRSNTGRQESIRVVVTNHGPIISGGPDKGVGFAFKYTATESLSESGFAGLKDEQDNPDNRANPENPDSDNHWPAILWKMLRARNADELVESQRGWVDPVNNFVFADVDGNYGYFCRGRIPIRSRVNGWLPVPGWTGEHEWQGDIPFEELPKSINPSEGYIATANNRPVGDDYPHYIAVDFTPEFRVQGVTQGLMSLTKPAAPDMAKVHAQRVSQPALAYLAILPSVEPQYALSAIARERLLAWDGSMDAHCVEPAIYSAMRDALLKELFERNLPPDLADAAWHPADRGLGSFGNRLKARMVEMLRHDDRSLLADGDTWAAAISRALARGVADLKDLLGDDPDGWTWSRLHRAVPRHTLSDSLRHSRFRGNLAALLDPPDIPHSGDGDTPLQGGYSPATFATVTSLSVARYAYDTANWDNSLWVVPLGSSGHPGSPHYHDQSETWRKVEMVPMRWNWPDIIANSETTQTLEPG